jgi:hypothetical protein
VEEDDLNLTDASMPLGALSAAQMAPVLAAKTRVADAAQKQADFYDRMEQEIRARRAGPTTSERLYELGAAMMAPTRVRGFSGTMGNILPVLQQQSQERRKGEESRQEALNALLEGRMKGEQALAGRDLATQLAMARLTAAGNKPKYDPISGGTGYQQRPGTGGAPEFPQQDEFGNYVLTDSRQVNFLPTNARMILAGGDPTKPKYNKPAS